MAKKTEDKKTDVVVAPPPSATLTGEVLPPARNIEVAKPASMVPINLGSDVPDWLKEEMAKHAPLGMDAMQNSDIIYPRLVLAQGLTPAVQDGKWVSGDMRNNLDGSLLAKQGTPLRFIPVIFSRTRMNFKPISEGGGILCRSDDSITSRKNGVGVDQGGNPTLDCGQCVHKEWDDSATDPKLRKPKCALFFNVMGLLPDFGYMPTVWSGKATQLPILKRFMSACKIAGVHLFAMKFEIVAVNDEGGGYKYKNFDFARVPGFNSREEYMHALKLYNDMDGKTWSADMSDVTGDEDDTGAAVDGSNTTRGQVSGTDGEPF